MKIDDHSRISALAAALVLVCLAIGCRLWEDDQPPPPPSMPTIFTVIDSMASDLVSGGICSSDEAGTIAASSRAAVAADGSDPADFEELLPVAAGGAIAGLSSLTGASWTDAKRTDAVESIASSIVAAMNGKFAATTMGMSRMAASPGSEAVRSILARIAKAAVSNLSKTGISPQNIGNAASGVLGSMIGSLGEGGVNKTLVSEAVRSIAQSAVSMLEEAGLSSADAIASAVETISKGGVTALAAIDVDGVGDGDYSALAGKIAGGAASALGSLSTSATEIVSLAAAVAAGTAAGVAAISGSVDAEVVAEMSQGAAAGTVEGALAVTTVNTSAIATTLIAGITSSASTSLGDGGVHSAAALEGIAVGAAAAAVEGGVQASALTTSVIVINAGSTTVDVPSAIAYGISLGTNEAPVVSAGPDRSAKVGAAFDLLGTASDADAGDTLAYEWTVASKPATATVTLSAPAALSTSFTPDVAGTYIFSLRVSDGKATVEAFCTVVATAATNPVYKGMTAAERLESAKVYMSQGEWVAARDELLILLTFYPETEVNPEGCLRLGMCYDALGAYDLAVARFRQVVDDYPDSVPMPEARVRLGALLLWIYNRIDDALAQFNAVIAMTGLETFVYPCAIHSLACVEFKRKNYAQAITYENLAIADARADQKVLFWAQSGICQVYTAQGNYPAAEAAYALLLTDPKYTCVDPTDPSTRNLGDVCQAYMNLGWLYKQEGKVADQVALLKGQAASTTISYPKYMRLEFICTAAEREIWDMASTRANFQQAKDDLTAALAAYPGSDENSKRQRAWAQLRLGQANGRLVDVATSSAEKATFSAAAKAAFDQVILGFTFSWGVRQAGEALAEKASRLFYDDRDYSGAEALLARVVSEYPASADQYPKALAYLVFGDLNRDRGWKAKDSYAEDYAVFFTQAIYYYRKVMPDYFPSLNPTTWFFNRSLSLIGECYYGQDQYSQARDCLSPLLSNSAFSDGEKAGIQFIIGRAYAGEMIQNAEEGHVDVVQSMLTTVVDAFAAVSNYTNNDGSPVNNGQDALQAWEELARTCNDTSDRLTFLDEKLPLIGTVATAGIAALPHLGFEDYPNLGTTQWAFYWGRFWVARCYMQRASASASPGTSADWDGARTVCVDLLNDIGAHRILDQYMPSTRHLLASTYLEQATRLEKTSANKAQIILLCATAINNFAELLTSTAIALDGGGASAWAVVNSVFAYAVLCDSEWIGWDGSSPDAPSAVAGYRAEALALMNASWAFRGPDGATLVENGKQAAAGHEMLGQLLMKCGYIHAQAGQADAASGYFDEAIDAFAAVETYSGAEPRKVMSARQNRAHVSLEKCGLYIADSEFAAAATAFDLAADLTASLIADAETLVAFPARAIADMGWACIHHGPALVGHYSEFATEADWRAHASTWFNLVIGNPQYSAVDGGQVLQSCEDGLQWLTDNPPAP